MESANRGESERCLELARKALQAGDVARAERLTHKAMKLFPHDEVLLALALLREADRVWDMLEQPRGKKSATPKPLPTVGSKGTPPPLRRGNAGAPGTRHAKRCFPTHLVQVRKFMAVLERTKNGSGTSTSVPQANGHHGSASRGDAQAGAAPPPAPAGMGGSSTAGLHHRQRGGAGGTAAGSHRHTREAADEDHKATPDQRELVAQIRSKTCFYEASWRAAGEWRSSVVWLLPLSAGSDVSCAAAPL